ncbi:hypothetical protein AVEN_100563-1 [Araneus ventricosus]|uniref:Uncharacterized protein n=1 Tax=Araneus ventricosus TaxID=182803 RepID=A0A4Y2FIE2_ARAVE|nr:hypothetical protein AVEN_100563-1 [Araneus ventricosus]
MQLQMKESVVRLQLPFRQTAIICNTTRLIYHRCCLHSSCQSGSAVCLRSGGHGGNEEDVPYMLRMNGARAGCTFQTSCMKRIKIPLAASVPK